MQRDLELVPVQAVLVVPLGTLGELAAHEQQLLGERRERGALFGQRHGLRALAASGRLAGIALTHPDGRDRLLPVAAWPAEALGDIPSAVAPGARLPLDELYERALLLALQVIVLR